MVSGVANARDHRESQIAEILGRYELAHVAHVLGVDEMDALLARVERLGNRVAASVLAAGVIQGVVQLAARRRYRPWPHRGRRTASTKLEPFTGIGR